MLCTLYLLSYCKLSLSFNLFYFYFRDFYRLIDYEIDYDTLLFCVSKAKLLYQIMLRSNENFIHTEDLLIEFKAGNTQESYLTYILQNDGKSKIDFMDYLTYFPLFINTHKNIIEMPYS